MYRFDWFNKEIDWSIAEQDSVRWEILTWEGKGWSQESPTDAEEAEDEHSLLIKVPPHDRASIRNMG